MLTETDNCLECVTHTHTHVESRNSLDLVNIFKNNINEKYIKLVM